MPPTAFCSTTNRRSAAKPSSRARSRAPWPPSSAAIRSGSISATSTPSATGDMPAPMPGACGASCSRTSRTTTCSPPARPIRCGNSSSWPSAISIAPFDGAIDMAEGQLDEFPHRMGLAGGEHVVVRLVLLQDAPHAPGIGAGMSPVALGVEVAEIEPLLMAALDGGHGARDLARDEGFAADRRFVVEQNAVGGMHAVGFAVVHRDPVGIELGHRVGAARIEWRQLALRRLLDLT